MGIERRKSQSIESLAKYAADFLAGGIDQMGLNTLNNRHKVQKI
jgi:hypothetical protein